MRRRGICNKQFLGLRSGKVVYCKNSLGLVALAKKLI